MMTADGVSNDLDLCPNTPAGAVVDANGCAASQLAAFGPDDVNPQKVAAMTVEYTGDGCAGSSHNQNTKKVKCDDVLNTGDTVNCPDPFCIKATDKRKRDTYTDPPIVPGVLIGGTFVIDAANAGKEALKGDTLVRVYNGAGDRIESTQFHTSCSQSLAAGDQFGSLKITNLFLVPE